MSGLRLACTASIGLAVLLSILSGISAENTDAGIIQNSGSSSQKKAEHIRALIKGALDVEIDPSDLFRVELVPGSADLRGINALLTKLLTGRGVPPSDGQIGEEELWQARVAFLRLPSKKRRDLLKTHRTRQAAAAEQDVAQSRIRAEIDRATLRATNIDALLKGELDNRMLPQELLTLELLAADGTPLPRHRLARLLGEPKMAGLNSAETSNTGDLAVAHAHLDTALNKFLALSNNEQVGLIEAHEQRQRELASSIATAEERTQAEANAKRAAERREQALAAARAADTEGARLLQEERARLLGIRENQAEFRAVLIARKDSLQEHRERSLKWNRKVSEAIAVDEKTAAREYDALVAVLTEERKLFREALDSLARSKSTIPPTTLPPPISIPSHIDTSTLDPLRREISKTDSQLRALEPSVQWAIASALRDGVVAMNQDRLRLLPHIPYARRSDLQGFGPEGIAQAAREFGQIVLETRFRTLAFPRSLSAVRHELGRRPLDSVLTFIKLFLVIAAFRIWRRRSPDLLAKTRQAWIERRPQTRLSLSVAGAVWYAQRVRAPLEWLALLWALGSLLPEVADFPELGLLWRVVVWCLIGAFAVRMVDAIAARQPHSRIDDTSQLRYRSLRLVGVVSIVLGLLLSITRSLVGEGAIYTWVWRSCWALALPLAFVLFVRWRPIIFARAENHPSPNRFLNWAVNRNRGLWSVVATVVGGVALLVEGVMRWGIRQASAMAVTRRLLAHLFRREVEKHAAEVDESLYQPLSPDTLARLREAQQTLVVDDIEDKHIERIYWLG